MNTKKSPASILAKIKSGHGRYRLRTVSRAAADLGRLGGLVGGQARANALTPAQRSKIATHAALIRWGRHSVY